MIAAIALAGILAVVMPPAPHGPTKVCTFDHRFRPACAVGIYLAPSGVRGVELVVDFTAGRHQAVDVELDLDVGSSWKAR